MLWLFPSSATAPSYCPRHIKGKWGHLKLLLPCFQIKIWKSGSWSLGYLKSRSPSSKGKFVREVIHSEPERCHSMWWKQQQKQPWQEKQQARPHCHVLPQAHMYGGLLVCGVGHCCSDDKPPTSCMWPGIFHTRTSSICRYLFFLKNRKLQPMQPYFIVTPLHHFAEINEEQAIRLKRTLVLHNVSSS
jgi:hypothetical protein